MQVIVELSLKIPRECPRFKLPRREIESVRVIMNPRLFEPDNDLDAPVSYSCGPLEKRVLISRKLDFDFAQVFTLFVVIHYYSGAKAQMASLRRIRK